MKQLRSFTPPPGRKRALIRPAKNASVLASARFSEENPSLRAEWAERIEPSGQNDPGSARGEAKGEEHSPQLSGREEAGARASGVRPVPNFLQESASPRDRAEAGGIVPAVRLSSPTRPAKVRLEPVPACALPGAGSVIESRGGGQMSGGVNAASSLAGNLAGAPASSQTGFQGGRPAGERHGASPAAACKVPRSPAPSAFAPARQTGTPAGENAASLAAPRRRLRPKRVLCAVLSLVAALVVGYAGWGLYLASYVSKHMDRVSALSSAPADSGETWLIAGSDARSDGSDGGIVGDDIGVRTDSIMLVRKTNSESMVVSLPRDTAVEIPGHGVNKINAAFALGGAKLLVQTVEALTGTKVDHYVQLSMGAVTQIVDAVGGVELCYDAKVNDEDSALVWPGGCHRSDGKTALAFARMRKSDPLGDIGRATRQRQVVKNVVAKLRSPWTFFNFPLQKRLVGAVSKNVVADPETGAWSLFTLARTYRAASGAGLTGAPPISSFNYRSGNHGAMVKLNSAEAPGFWRGFRQGTLRPEQYQQN